MKTGITLLAMSCALALAACGGDDRQTTADTATTDPVNAAPADAITPDTQPVASAPIDPMAPADATAMGDQATPIDPALDRSAPDAVADATGATDAAADQAPASSGGCDITLEGNDRMQFNLDQINIPASCSEFTINLNHVGQLPEAAMGHNVVIVETSDFAEVAADGITAGADAGYVPAGDDRVIAASEMIGGGESTSVSFSTASLEEGGDYTFFCSFPGHSALMRGSLNFGG